MRLRAAKATAIHLKASYLARASHTPMPMLLEVCTMMDRRRRMKIE